MTGSEITGLVTHTVKLGGSDYPSPRTITSTGDVAPNNFALGTDHNGETNTSFIPIETAASLFAVDRSWSPMEERTTRPAVTQANPALLWTSWPTANYLQSIGKFVLAKQYGRAHGLLLRLSERRSPPQQRSSTGSCAE